MEDTYNRYIIYKYDIFINILLGFICGIIIYKFYLCPPIIRGPNSRDIVDEQYEIDGRYYELEPVICGCLWKPT
jgi:hypothetical protein